MRLKKKKKKKKNSFALANFRFCKYRESKKETKMGSCRKRERRRGREIRRKQED
jgi:hypothetical protein